MAAENSSNNTDNQTEYTLEEVAKHNTKKDIWIVVHGVVCDITEFQDDHPGGDDVLRTLAGKDASDEFDNFGHSTEAKQLVLRYQKGVLKGAKVTLTPTASHSASAESAAAQDAPIWQKLIVPFLIIFLAIALSFFLP